jgi:hypothetical protein
MRNSLNLLITIKPQPTKTRQFIPISIFLFLINLAAGNFGAFTAPFIHCFSFISLLSLLLFYAPIQFLGNSKLKKVKLIFLFFVALVFVTQNSVYRIFAASIFIYAIKQNLKNQNRKPPELSCLLQFAIIYTAYMIVCMYIPLLAKTTEIIAQFFSSTSSYISGNPVKYGPTYIGLNTNMSIFLLCIVIVFKNKGTRLYWTIGILFYISIATLFYINFHNWVISTIGYSNPFILSFFINSTLSLFFILLPCVYLSLPPYFISNFTADCKNRFVYIGSGILLILVLTPSWILDDQQRNKSKKIVFHNEGQVDWNVPVFGKYGGKNGGMFGTVIKHLNVAGYEVLIDSISKETLKNAALLVLINANRQFSLKEKKLVWSFVKKGGGLWVLGDHTGKEFIRHPFNDLLSPVNIEFNFDSAISMVPNWVGGHNIVPHFITKNIRNENDIQIWIGASLSVSYPAKPLIIGKYAFSDKGNMMAPNMGYLGDMHYVPGERLGDIPLVATSNFGKGRVLVFGDTSSIQNSAIFFSTAMVQRIVYWLTNDKNFFYPFDRLFTSLVGLFIMLNFTVANHRIRLVAIILSLSFTAMVLAGTIYQYQKVKNETPKKVPVSLPIALIDASHLGLFSMDAWGGPNGFGGLAYNLERNGYLPIVMKKFNNDIILNSKLLIIMSPLRQYSLKEIGILDEFFDNGGNLILAVGWEEKKPSQSLLNYLGINVKNIPLGYVQPKQNSSKLSFRNAWSLSFDNDVTDVLATVWDEPVAIFQPRGNGGFLMVGDSKFFLNENLEGLLNYSPDNIRFLKEIFRDKFVMVGTKQ